MIEISQKKIQSRRQEKRLIQKPYSEKSAVSAKEPSISRKEAAKLTAKLHDLAIQRDWAQGQANKNWEKAKEYEAQGRIDMTLEAKTRCEKEVYRVKCYNREIDEIEKMIEKLSLGKNYAMMKVEEPPSDNQE